MNAFQTCKDTSDILPLYIPQQLFLKPTARMNVSLQLPNVVKNGKSISHLEIMDKLRDLLKPQEFSELKVSKSTLEFVRFEAEVDTKKKLEAAVLKLNNKTIKLKNFSELMRVKAAIAKSDFPSRQAWDSFFNEAKDMDEFKPGQRPDTVHISNLPTKWFVPYHLLDEEDLLPSEKLFYKIFEKFGPIRCIDIPLCDPYRNKMKDHISGIKNSSWDDKCFFEGYVQYKDYMGFSKCMDYLRDMKLIHKEEEEVFTVNIKVDFDRSKHLSEASIRRREIVRDRLVKKQREKEEREMNEVEEKKRKEEEEKKRELTAKQQKEQRRRLREEKRKAAILEKLKIKSADEINAKIAKEEKKLLKAQRKLESIRLLEELFRRIKEKREIEEVNSYNVERSKNADSELRKYKFTSEKELLDQKQKLHNVLQGRVMLKTVLKGGKHDLTSSSDEDIPPNNSGNPDELYPVRGLDSGDIYPEQLLYGYPYHLPGVYPQSMRGHPAFNLLPTRGRRGYFRGSQYASASRGGYFNRRSRGYKSQYRGGYHGGRNQYPPELEEEYIKYFSKFLNNDTDHRRNRSRSRTRRSRSRSKHTSYSRSRSRSNSRHRRSRSRRRSSRSRSTSRTHSRHRSRSRRSRSRSRRSRSRRSKRSASKDRSRSRNRSRSRRTSEGRRDSRKSRSLSKDSSKFISPNRMRKDRSKSWSLPREEEKRKRDSWSRSPEKRT
ncbi:A-kinase anchor protein 17A-like isoform X1 [Harmonia axyridis]|uniref:A-kinase anchor protein 17A-like isoform X1 n=2 Tax=Harmonia axyridis TaxID=115357 RepID=UPI001E2797CD|nr:A-kinase anchor protein 17A-like isoform X1 [Harmonia axyridis]